MAISILCLVVGVAAPLLALRSWRRTRDEQPGSAHHLLSSGNGRTRFLAVCGLLSSVLFLIALVAASATLFLLPLCGG